MQRWLGRSILGVIVLGALIGALLFVALGDNPAGPATGERRIAAGPAGEIHYYASGPASAPVIALVPSFARSASDFNELVRGLNRAGYRTFAMQPRGIDGSELPSRQLTLHDYAADLHAVLEAEAVAEPVVVLGHAYGNRVARTFGSDFPDRTRALILLAAGGSKPSPPEASNRILLALLRILPEAQRREAIAKAFFAKGVSVPASWMRGWYPMAGLAEQNANQATPYAEWGAGGNAPMLILEAEEDALAPGAGAQLRAEYPSRVRLRGLQKTGHAILPERPKEVSKEILGYLAAQN